MAYQRLAELYKNTNQPALAEQNSEKAFALRNNTSLEKL